MILWSIAEKNHDLQHILSGRSVRANSISGSKVTGSNTYRNTEPKFIDQVPAVKPQSDERSGVPITTCTYWRYLT